jgi:hypothetical protein
MTSRAIDTGLTVTSTSAEAAFVGVRVAPAKAGTLARKMEKRCSGEE